MDPNSPEVVHMQDMIKTLYDQRNKAQDESASLAVQVMNLQRQLDQKQD